MILNGLIGLGYTPDKVQYVYVRVHSLYDYWGSMIAYDLMICRFPKNNKVSSKLKQNCVQLVHIRRLNSYHRPYEVFEVEKNREVSRKCH